jgi:hypothetical protein
MYDVRSVKVVPVQQTLHPQRTGPHAQHERRHRCDGQEEAEQAAHA